MLLLSGADVESLLSVADMLDALERGFVAFSSGAASAPPRTAARAPRGLLGAMPGYVEGGPLVIKAVSVFPENTGKPSHQGVIALFDEGDGTPLCIMDATHITAMRTGGGSAVSARLLARPDATTLAILGAGVQGRSHLLTVATTRAFREIRIASINREHAEQLAALDDRCVVVDGFEAAVRDVDVVCCCTDARAPIVDRAWLAPGAHVTSVGGTFGPELDAGTVQQSRVFVEWRGAAAHAPPAGARELQGVDPAALTELGEVIAGTHPGRQSPDEITVYKSTGFAVEDAVVARLVYDAALTRHAGQAVEL